jgi:hypothetical protein
MFSRNQLGISNEKKCILGREAIAINYDRKNLNTAMKCPSS